MAGTVMGFREKLIIGFGFTLIALVFLAFTGFSLFGIALVVLMFVPLLGKLFLL